MYISLVSVETQADYFRSIVFTSPSMQPQPTPPHVPQPGNPAARYAPYHPYVQQGASTFRLSLFLRSSLTLFSLSRFLQMDLLLHQVQFLHRKVSFNKDNDNHSRRGIRYIRPRQSGEGTERVAGRQEKVFEQRGKKGRDDGKEKKEKRNEVSALSSTQPRLVSR